MIVKALLAWAGLRAVPEIHNQAVHDALNVRTAVAAGHERLLRLQRARDRVVAEGNDQAAAIIARKQNEVRAGLDELARRLG